MNNSVEGWGSSVNKSQAAMVPRWRHLPANGKGRFANVCIYGIPDA